MESPKSFDAPPSRKNFPLMKIVVGMAFIVAIVLAGCKKEDIAEPEPEPISGDFPDSTNIAWAMKVGGLFLRLQETATTNQDTTTLEQLSDWEYYENAYKFTHLADSIHGAVMYILFINEYNPQCDLEATSDPKPYDGPFPPLDCRSD